MHKRIIVKDYAISSTAPETKMKFLKSWLDTAMEVKILNEVLQVEATKCLLKHSIDISTNATADEMKFALLQMEIGRVNLRQCTFF